MLVLHRHKAPALANKRIFALHDKFTLEKIFRDARGTMPAENPVTADSSGAFSFYAQPFALRLLSPESWLVSTTKFTRVQEPTLSWNQLRSLRQYQKAPLPTATAYVSFIRDAPGVLPRPAHLQVGA
jgi:hypothetical protein